MELKPRVSVLTLSYNAAPFIGKCLEYLVNQKTNFPFVVIVGDDCSTDGNQEIIKEYAQKYPNIIKPYFNEQNIGMDRNTTKAYTRIQSEYVCICDGDDYFTDENKLQLQVDFLDTHKDCSVCIHRYETVFFYDKNQNIKPHRNFIWPSDEFLAGRSIFTLDDLVEDNLTGSSTLMYRWMFTPENFEHYCPTTIRPLDYYMSLLHATKGNIGFIDRCMSQYNKHANGTWKNWSTPDFSDYLDFVFKNGLELINLYKAVESKIAKDKVSYRKKYIGFVIDYYESLLKHHELEKAQELLAYFSEIPSDIFDEKDKYEESFIELYTDKRRRYYIDLKVKEMTLKQIDLPQNIYLYGAGTIGKKFFDCIKSKCNVLGFIDKYSKEDSYGGVKIFTLSDERKFDEATIIVTAPYYLKDIKKDLVSVCGIDPQHIISVEHYLSTDNDQYF